MGHSVCSVGAGSITPPSLLLRSVSGRLVYFLQTPGLELVGSFPTPSFSFLTAGAQVMSE